jgi:hypothetical protein
MLLCLGEIKAMQLLFYTGRNDMNTNRLEEAVYQAVQGREIERFTQLDSLRERFRFIVEPDSIAVLFAADRKELQEMQTLRHLLPEIYVILVIPDWNESTVKLAHLLLPRFLSQKEDSFTDLIEVLKKMVGPSH